MLRQIGDRRRAMPDEPRRLQFPLVHLAGHDDLEGPFTQSKFGQVVAGVAQIVLQQAVTLVALPVEFFLKSDHLTTNSCSLSSCGLQTGWRWKRTLNSRFWQETTVFDARLIQEANERHGLLVSDRKVLKFGSGVIKEMFPELRRQSTSDTTTALVVASLLHPKARQSNY